MKKMKTMLLMGLVLLFAFALAGCGDDKEDRLEDEVDRLEQQVTDLENEKAAGGTSTDATADQAADGTQSSGDFAALETAVNAQVEKVEAAVPDAEEAKKLDQYFALKKEIEELDRQLDAYDDLIESQYRQKSITLDELRTQEQNLDMLESKLDGAEDKLEIVFGIDD